MPHLFIPRRQISRRSLLVKGMTAGLLATAGSRAFRDVSLIGRAMAFSTPTNYKALVCIFLNGGNDSNNMIVPTSTRYADYQLGRGDLALPSNSLISMSHIDDGGTPLGLHPSCAPLSALSSNLAMVLNVGTLVATGTNSTNYRDTSHLVPQLGSHSDQISQWQSSSSPGTATGWGGRVADIVNPIANTAPLVPMNISLAGVNTFEAGASVAQYHVSSEGVVEVSTQGSVHLSSMRALLADADLSTNLQRRAYAEAMEGAIQKGSDLQTVLADPRYQSDPVWGTAPSDLASQLSMVARLIAAHSDLGASRQIFFCSLGGFDTHSSQIDQNADGTWAPTSGNHADLLSDLAGSMAKFYQALGSNQANVVTFTASDFSRTFETNSAVSSDHAWGGHHLVMGPVTNDVVGRLPSFSSSEATSSGALDYLPQGRFVPAYSVEQYSATLAKWFGLSDADLAAVFPNLSAFATSNLGFL